MYSYFLQELNGGYYDVFEELYGSYLSDLENTKLKLEMLMDEQNDLEAKIEMVRDGWI